MPIRHGAEAAVMSSAASFRLCWRAPDFTVIVRERPGAVTERRVSLALPKDGTLKPGHDLEPGRFQLGGDRVHSVLVRDPNLASLFGSYSLLLPCPRESLRLSA